MIMMKFLFRSITQSDIWQSLKGNSQLTPHKNTQHIQKGRISEKLS